MKYKQGGKHSVTQFNSSFIKPIQDNINTKQQINME
jgi:hypothetical protein